MHYSRSRIPDQDLRLTRARAYAHAGQNSQATTDLAVVRASAKPNARQLNSLCWTEAPFDAFVDAALVDCDAALKLQPLSAQTLDSRAFVSFRLGHLDDALTLYGKALALEPHHASSFYGRGLTYLKKGQTAQGRADIVMAKRIAPYVGRAFDLMGLRP